MTSYENFFFDVAGFSPFPYQARLGTVPWPTLLDTATAWHSTVVAPLSCLHKRLEESPLSRPDFATGGSKVPTLMSHASFEHLIRNGVDASPKRFQAGTPAITNPVEKNR